VHAYYPGIGFLVFLLLSTVLVFGYGPVHVNEEEIAMFTASGKYFIRWDEIRTIEHGQSHLVFIGEKKRLTVPHPMFWMGKDRKAVVEVLECFYRSSGITPVQSLTADFKFSKNAKKTA